MVIQIEDGATSAAGRDAADEVLRVQREATRRRCYECSGGGGRGATSVAGGGGGAPSAAGGAAISN